MALIISPSLLDSKRFHLFLISIFTFLAFLPSVYNGILVYDDPQWTMENALIASFDLHNLKLLFTSATLNMYAPMVHLSFALDRSLGGMQPFIFHFTNVILHVANALLAYSLLTKLFSKRKTAFILALLFSVHPVQVASVAWISTRSNLLCALFLLCAMLSYVNYLKNDRKLRSLFFTFLFFVFACLSKSAALALPFILLLFDHLEKREWHFKLLLEKTPFFIVALLIGLLAIHFRNDLYTQHLQTNYDLIDKFFLLTYSFCVYIQHFFVPYPLSALYTYPQKVNGSFPIAVYLSALILPALAALPFLFKKFKRPLIFGLLFFLTTLGVSMIGFFEDGFTADRYAYVPYLGLFFLLGILFEHFASIQKINLSFMTVIALLFSVLSFYRCSVWKDDLALFNDVISKQPGNAFAYNSRGVANYIRNDIDEAQNDYTRAIELDPYYAEAYYNRAIIYDRNNAFGKALVDYTKAIELNPLSARSYFGRGVVKMEGMHDADGALEDYANALRIDPEFAQVYFNRAKLYLDLGNNEAACTDLNKVRALGFSKADELLDKFCK